MAHTAHTRMRRRARTCACTCASVGLGVCPAHACACAHARMRVPVCAAVCVLVHFVRGAETCVQPEGNQLLFPQHQIVGSESFLDRLELVAVDDGLERPADPLTLRLLVFGLPPPLVWVNFVARLQHKVCRTFC